MRGHADIGIAARDDVGGVVVYRSDADAFALAPITADGAPHGTTRFVHTPGALDVAGVRMIGEEALVVLDAACEDGLRPCRFAQRFTVTAESVGPRVGRRIVDREAHAYRWRPLDVTHETGDVLWMVRGIDTSHAGEGVALQRIHVLEDGTPQLDDVTMVTSDTPEGTLTSTVFFGDATRVTSIYGWRGFDVPRDRDVSRRFFSFDGTHVTELQGLGGVIRDLVVQNARVSVLVRKDDDAFIATFDSAGRPSGPALRVDVDEPLPPPFTDRLLVRLELDPQLYERDGPVAFTPTDALGRRVGDPIELARNAAAAMTFTGSHFLVATHPVGTDTTQVVRIACGMAD